MELITFFVGFALGIGLAGLYRSLENQDIYRAARKRKAIKIGKVWYKVRVDEDGGIVLPEDYEPD